MIAEPTRRRILIGALALPALALPGCVTVLNDRSFEAAVQRLLTRAAQRALARLVVENGFYADAIARVNLPPELGGTGATSLLAALLQSPTVQDQLLRQVNQAASYAARTAAPVVYQAIRELPRRDAVRLIRGGSTAATDRLRETLGTRLADAMLPQVARTLDSSRGGIVNNALAAATGINLIRLRQDVARNAAEGLLRAIASEETVLRADPAQTGDPLLQEIFKPVLRPD